MTEAALVYRFRLEVQQLRQGNLHKLPHHGHLTQEKNDHLTMKWLSNAVAEMKTEVAEIQTTLNSTVILQNHEEVYTELRLLRADASNLNKELEIARTKNAKYEAELMEVREEVGSLRDHCRATAAMCGKMKNQVRLLAFPDVWKFYANEFLLRESFSNAIDFKTFTFHLVLHSLTLETHTTGVTISGFKFKLSLNE